MLYRLVNNRANNEHKDTARTVVYTYCKLVYTIYDIQIVHGVAYFSINCNRFISYYILTHYSNYFIS